MMATPFERIKAAWDSTDRGGELNRVVELMASEGVTRDALDDGLGKLLDEIREAGADDATEEIINSVGDRLHGWCHESWQIKSTATLPTKEEVERLPRWAWVAFATRCARRLLPLFSRKWSDAPPSYVQQLHWAVDVGERSAGSAGAGDDWAPPAGALACAAYACEAIRYADRDRAAAANYIEAMSLAVAKFKDKAENVFDPHIGEFFYIVTHNASDTIANGIATSHETYNAAVKFANSVIRHDFDHLRRYIAERKWTEDTPVPMSVFGPLWPDGLPENWPMDQDDESDQYGRTEMTVRQISELLVA